VQFNPSLSPSTACIWAVIQINLRRECRKASLHGKFHDGIDEIAIILTESTGSLGSRDTSLRNNQLNITGFQSSFIDWFVIIFDFSGLGGSSTRGFQQLSGIHSTCTFCTSSNLGSSFLLSSSTEVIKLGSSKDDIGSSTRGSLVYIGLVNGKYDLQEKGYTKLVIVVIDFYITSRRWMLQQQKPRDTHVHFRFS
jgi:hypothetical protein